MVPTADILTLLRTHFPQITEPALQEEIAQSSHIVHCSTGEMLIDYGSYVRVVPLVTRGSLKVMREDEEGNELFLYYLKPSEVCSMSFTCCMMNKRSVIRAVAEDETTLIAVPIQQVANWTSKYQSWRNFVMLAYDQRMYELVKVIDNIAFSKMDERLIDYLKKRSSAIQSSTITATHQEIAHDLNASREAISRLLKKLERMNHVRLGRNEVEIL